ncbi:MAG: hypothetical protein ACRD5H_13420, partial [Nitrososphaerales archaeon]
MAMILRSPVTRSFVACALLVIAQSATAFSLSNTVWERASKKTCQVDPLLLYAVALVESKKYAGHTVTPNPLALNIGDVGHHPKTLVEAQRLLTDG